MFIGLVLIGPVALKLASTGYRFARYYTGAPRYRAKARPSCRCACWLPSSSPRPSASSRSGVALLIVGHRSDTLLSCTRSRSSCGAPALPCTSCGICPARGGRCGRAEESPARVTAWRDHQVAYVESLNPSSSRTSDRAHQAEVAFLESGRAAARRPDRRRAAADAARGARARPPQGRRATRPRSAG